MCVDGLMNIELDCKIHWIRLQSILICCQHAKDFETACLIMIEIWIKSRATSFGNQELNKSSFTHMNQIHSKALGRMSENLISSILLCISVSDRWYKCIIPLIKIKWPKGRVLKWDILYFDLLNIMTSALTRTREEAKEKNKTPQQPKQMLQGQAWQHQHLTHRRAHQSFTLGLFSLLLHTLFILMEFLNWIPSTQEIKNTKSEGTEGPQ